MDVLHVIKANHDVIKGAFARLEGADGVKARRLAFDEAARELQVHLLLEKDYLYPEVTGLFPGSDTIADVALASGVILGKKLKALGKLTVAPAGDQAGYVKKVAELREAVAAHLASEENQILPKMRDFIRTEDREDLGEVFEDSLSDIRRQFEQPVTPAPAAGRKRA